jgi:hypothetical protein
MFFTLRESTNGHFAASRFLHRIARSRFLSVFLLIHYICFPDLDFLANQRRYLPDRQLSVKAALVSQTFL